MFFNCPVSVDYQAVLNFILRLNIGQDIAQRVQDVQIENQHFVTQNIGFQQIVIWDPKGLKGP